MPAQDQMTEQEKIKDADPSWNPPVTIWNTPQQTVDTIDAANQALRTISLTRDGGSVRELDIIGENPYTVIGAVQGLANYTYKNRVQQAIIVPGYLGLSASTVRRFFASPDKTYARAVPVNPSIITALYEYSYDKEPQKLTRRPAMIIPANGDDIPTPRGRRVYDLRDGSPDWYSRLTQDAQGDTYIDAPLDVLRKRMFLAALVGGELRREPIFHGFKRVRHEEFAYRALSDALNDVIENYWLGKSDGYWISYAWTSMALRPKTVNDNGVDAIVSWELRLEYNEKLPSDTYTELETDTEGKATGEEMKDLADYDKDDRP